MGQKSASGKPRDQRLARNRASDLFGERALIDGWQAGIDRRCRAANFGHDGALIAGIADFEVVVKLTKNLGVEIVSRRLRTLVEGHVFCVLDNADDFEIRRV